MRGLWLAAAALLVAGCATAATGRGAGQLDSAIATAEAADADVLWIRFKGNAVFTDDELLRTIETTIGSGFSREQLDEDLVMLRARYLNEGYLDVDVRPAKVALSVNRRLVRALTIAVDEGPRYRLGALDLHEGADAGQPPSTQPLPWPREVERVIEIGDIAALDKLQEQVDRFTRYHKDRGFAFAEARIDKEFDRQRHMLDLKAAIAKGRHWSRARALIWFATTAP